jgi:ATP/maltotriose-dependent transcriptional regulator MalT/DNA-binding SARP family transcriptional activator
MAPERLRRLSAAMQARSAVIITAPAGYGKTTLLVNALNGCRSGGCRVCWYRLDDEDGDLAVFYAHLVEALFPEVEQAGDEVRSDLAGCSDIFARHQYLNALICQELWDWHARCPHAKTFIVFDDFQHVQDTPEITDAVRFLSDNLPDNCTIIVSSRWETGLLAGKRMLSRGTLEISRSDLCFSEDELAAFIEEECKIMPDSGLVRKILLRTEGWVAGIILVCQMLSLNGADRAGDFLDRSGEKEPFFEYIVAEVLKTVDDRLLHFLVKAAILHEFTASEAGAICEEDGAADLLRQCERKGLFIQNISGPKTTYCFHSLFREFLQQIQPRYLSPEEVRHCHLKAAAYYIEDHNFSRAVEHFIACGSNDQAVALIMRESARLIAFEAADQFRLWFRQLPGEVISGSGHLLFIESFIHYQRDLDHSLNLLKQALTLFQQTDDIGMQFHTVTQIASSYILRNDVQNQRKFHALAMELSGRLQGTTLADLLATFDFCTVAVWEEHLVRGIALSRGLRSLALNVEWQYAARFYTAFTYYLTGDLGLAEGEAQEALALEFIKRSTLFKGYCQLLYAGILQLKDEPDAFSMQMSELLETGEKHDYKYVLAFGKRLAAIDCYRRHDLEGALELLDTSISLWEELGNQAMANSNRLYRCLWLCRREPHELSNVTGHHREDARELLAEANKALKALTARPSGMCLREIGLSVFGAIAREAGDYQLAEKNLAAAVRRSRGKGARQILAGSCLHLAKLYYDTGDRARGEEYLRQALDLAVDNKYVMFWDLHFPTLIEMAARCIKSRIHAGYAQTLVARYFGDEAAEFLGGTALLTPDDRLRDLAGVFLGRYGQASHRETRRVVMHANCLGGFHLFVNGVEVSKAEWRTQKSEKLFKLMLIANDKLPKEQVIEEVWPDTNPQAGDASLRMALTHIRKALRLDRYGIEGVVQRRGLVYITPEIEIHTDYQAFAALARDGLRLADNGNPRAAGLLKQAIELYGGIFLPDDLYEDWPANTRTWLQNLYLQILSRLIDLNLQQDQVAATLEACRRYLELEPADEQVIRTAMELYWRTGQRQKAIVLFQCLSTLLADDYGVRPSPETVALYERLRQEQ